MPKRGINALYGRERGLVGQPDGSGGRSCALHQTGRSGSGGEPEVGSEPRGWSPPWVEWTICCANEQIRVKSIKSMRSQKVER